MHLKLAMLATATAPDTRRAALRAATESGAALTIDREAGIMRGVAVMTIGPATGHGFDVDAETLRLTLELIAAEADGLKMHFQHPQFIEGGLSDQLGEICGRLKDCRIDGATLRGDVYLGPQAKDLPGLGNVHDYLLTIAETDPRAIGLSVVMAYDLETVDDALGIPAAVVARPTKIIQCDFVGEGAACPNGLLSTIASKTTRAQPDEAEYARWLFGYLAALGVEVRWTPETGMRLEGNTRWVDAGLLAAINTHAVAITSIAAQVRAFENLATRHPEQRIELCRHLLMLDPGNTFATSILRRERTDAVTTVRALRATGLQVKRDGAKISISGDRLLLAEIVDDRMRARLSELQPEVLAALDGEAAELGAVVREALQAAQAAGFKYPGDVQALARKCGVAMELGDSDKIRMTGPAAVLAAVVELVKPFIEKNREALRTSVEYWSQKNLAPVTGSESDESVEL